MNLNYIDIYKIQNKRKKTYRKVGLILRDIIYKEENKQINSPLYLKKIKDEYNIDQRTLKRYLNGFIYKIGSNSLIVLNESDYLVIKETINTIKRYKNLNNKHQKLAKYITYYMLTGQTQN